MDGTNSSAPTRRAILGCAAGALGLAAAPIREEPEVALSLKNIVATSDQAGLLEVPWGRVLKSDDLGRLVDPRKVGPANLFLVVGKDIDTAMDATCAAFFAGISVDQPVVRAGDKRTREDHLWAFVYFGSAQTSPCEWKVTRAAIQRDRVRITICRPDPTKVMHTIHNRRVYMIWIPLGSLEQQGLTLEAFDEANRVTMMTRRVTIG